MMTSIHDSKEGKESDRNSCSCKSQLLQDENALSCFGVWAIVHENSCSAGPSLAITRGNGKVPGSSGARQASCWLFVK